MILAERINQKLAITNFQSLVGRTVTYRELRALANEIVGPFGGKVRLKRDATLSSKQKQFGLAISGYYEVGSPHVVVQYNIPKHRHRVTITPAIADRIQFLTIQTLQHELIHRGQYSYDPDGDAGLVPFIAPDSTPKQTMKDLLYFSQRYEIEAYANSLAYEILYYYPKETPKSVINRIDRCRKLSVYRLYKSAFKKADWQKVKKELLRQTWRWLPEIVLPTRVLTTGK